MNPSENWISHPSLLNISVNADDILSMLPTLNTPLSMHPFFKSHANNNKYVSDGSNSLCMLRKVLRHGLFCYITFLCKNPD